MRIKNLCLFFLFVIFFSCQKDLKPKSESAISIDEAVVGKPNIILILGDDVGFEIPTYSGGQSYQTPNLDFMAHNGRYFTNCFAMPDGPPARIELMTGKYSYRNFTEARHLNIQDKTIGNMLKNSGYVTGYVGKWHLDGGDASIKSHGFDNYLVFMPFDPEQTGHDQWFRRYKNPLLYQNGKYLSDASVQGKYSEDLYYNYISNFIDNNKTKPFFLIYACNLIQHPWSPTPDDPAFASWTTTGDERLRENIKYFPGMVKYMDKNIGKVLTKLNQAGINNKTIVLFISDNGSGPRVKSVWNGKNVSGGKLGTKRNSINVPLAVYGPSILSTPNGKKDTSFVDMTDFLVSFANIAKIGVPTTWGILDGKSFYDNLTGNINPAQQKKYYYTYWPTAYDAPNDLTSFIFDYNYKLYDVPNGGKFYNIRKDPNETTPLVDSKLTAAQKTIKTNFSKILVDGYRIAGQ